MTDQPELTRELRAWLQADLHESPDLVLEQVLGRLAALPQRRRSWLSAGAAFGGARAGLYRALAAALVVVALLAVTVLPSALRGPLAASPTPTASTSASGAPSPGAPSPSAGPAESSPSPGASPSPAGSVAPTPIPGPTLDWATVGYTLGVKSPVARGGKATVTITAPEGPTCSIAVTYPGGGAASEGAPSRPTVNKWVWSWTVPSSTPLGTASVHTTCTYAGLAKPGAGSFDIVAAAPTPTPKPTASPSWSITGTVGSPIAANGTLTFSGHVNGTPPPGIAPIDLNCRLYATDGGFDWLIAQDGSVQTRDFTLSGPIGAYPAGSHPWHVTCDATLSAGSRSVSGSFVVS